MSWTPESTRTRIFILAGITAGTIAVHYGLLSAVFGHVHWIHAIHGRLCYIPIVIAAAWFGLRGGLIVASAITILVLPFVFRAVDDPHNLAAETAEIVFYYAIAVLIGVLVEREFTARTKQQRAELQAERSHRLSLVGQIAAGVAHEVKNPLASIKGAADILSNDNTQPAERNEFKQILSNEIRRIDGTVAEFLEFARPKEIRIEKLNLTKVLAAAVKQMESHAASHGVRIESNLEPVVFVDADAEKSQQMVLNLLLNAIEASEDGGVVKVTLSSLNSGGGKLEVLDKGRGIKQGDMEHIFEPFYTTRADGTGLGLAVVKEIIDSHGASVDIQSEVGSGTNVVVTFPSRSEE